MARQAARDPLRQRPRVHQRRASELGGETGHPDRAHPAGQAAAERLRGALQPHRALRLAGPHPLRHDRTGAGQGDTLAMVLQSRAPEYGARRHHTNAETGPCRLAPLLATAKNRSEEHTSELQSLMRISYAVLCLKKKTTKGGQKKSSNTP